MNEPVIDPGTYENLKAMTGADFIAELMDAFFEETPALIETMRHALAEGNSEAFRRAAHSIKSSSASFGALQLSALALALERIGRAGELDGAMDQVEGLAAHYDEVVHALEALRDES